MPNDFQWKRIRSEKGPGLKLFDVRFDWMQHPNTGVVEKMVVLESNDSVNIIAVNSEAQMLLASQYRFGIGAMTLELAGGIVDDGEEPLQAAQRELREETGYTSVSWQYLGKSPSNPVFMDCYVHHFLATDVKLTHDTAWDPGEAIEVLSLPPDQVKAFLNDGHISHPHSIAALLRYWKV